MRQMRLAKPSTLAQGARLMKVVIVLLVLICAGLGFGLWKTNEKMSADRQAQEKLLAEAQSKLQSTETTLEEQRQVAAKLNEDLESRTTTLQLTSNEVEQLKATLSSTLAKASAEAEAAQQEISRKQEEIQQLEGRNANLSNRMQDLTGAITDLESQIADTERKLAASEGDREFLLAELKRMQAEKVDLERQFNDLALLRDQIRKLKDELSIASRLEWIRRGLYGPEPQGTEKLQPGFAQPAGQGNVDLEVEIHQGGGAEVISSTNTPALAP